jgi:DNA-directed RNA polymerase I subunit RPA2
MLRNAASAMQLKHAVAIPGFNYPYKLDKGISRGFIQNRPLVGTVVDDMWGPMGAYVFVSVRGWEGLGVEDPIVMNGGAVDRGMFGAVKHSFKSMEIKGSERIMIPNPVNTSDYRNTCNYGTLGPEGYVRAGTVLRAGCAILGRVDDNPNLGGKDTRPFVDRSEFYMDHEECFVIESYLSNDGPSKVFTFRYIVARDPVMGDKFSTRFGLKSVIGSITPEYLMPYTADGRVVGIILDDCAYNTRMCIAQQIVAYLNLLMLQMGEFVDASMFTEYDLQRILDILRDQYGISNPCMEYLYDPITGKRSRNRVFCYYELYLKLKKYSRDGMYAITRPKNNSLTKQPNSGRDGGSLKWGELEVISAVSSGAMGALNEKATLDADPYNWHYCLQCGMPADVNYGGRNGKNERYTCKTCSDSIIIRQPLSTWISGQTLATLRSMCIDVRVMYEQPHYYLRDE